MRQPLSIAVAQPRTVPCDVRVNALAHAACVRAAGARVVVFPEMSLTGYELDAPPVPLDDPGLAPLVEACAEAGAVALAGGPVIGAAGARHVGTLAIDGGGVRVAYRKMHLGGKEVGRFVPGPLPAAIDVDGWRLGLAICKDTGVPEQAAATAALGIDVYAAGVLEGAEWANVTDERAARIARDHSVWVAIASFAGSTGDGYDDAAGRSGIWAPDGSLIVQAGPEPDAFVRTTLR